MRFHPGLVAAGVTIAVLVPAAIVHLDAGPAQRGRLFAPATKTARIAGADIKIALDRHVADLGDTVHLQITATRAVEVGVVVFGSTGSEEARNPAPPRSISYRTVKLAPDASGRIAASVPVKLLGEKLEYVYDPFEHFAIYVTSIAGAARIKELRDGARATGGGEELGDPGTYALSQIDSAIRGTAVDHDDDKDDALFKAGTAAVVDAHARRVPAGLRVGVPERVVAGQPFALTVEVTNSTARHQKGLDVDIVFPKVGDAYLGLAIDAITVAEPELKLDLAPGETKRVAYTVTAARAGTLGIGAKVTSPDEELVHLYDGTFDAIEVVEASARGAVASRP